MQANNYSSSGTAIASDESDTGGESERKEGSAWNRESCRTRDCDSNKDGQLSRGKGRQRG